MGEVYFHVDLDAFFASVEQRDHPEYRNKPLIIGMPQKRSVVSTCSYEARRFGVHSAMPAIQAQKLCPQGIFIPGNYRLYQQVSRQVMEILSRFSPSMQQVSVDEAFLDMTGTGLLFGPPREACVKLKQAVREETQLTISVGVARNRFVAKLASDFHKPDGICVVSPSKEELFIDRVGLEKLWGIGKSTLNLIHSKGLTTTTQVRALGKEKLAGLFGENLADYLYTAVRGRDPGICSNQTKSHSVSTERTFIDDITDKDTLMALLNQMSTEVMFRAMNSHELARTVGVKIRYGNFETLTVQLTPDDPLLNTAQIYENAKKAFLSKWNGGGIRLLGVGLYNLYKGDTPIQGTLFDEEDQRRRRLDRAILDLSKKGHSLSKASVLEGKGSLSGSGPDDKGTLETLE